MEQKIISLLPAATEIVCMLGLERSLVGISDDSDYPLTLSHLPKITTTTLVNNLSSLEIDKKIKEIKHQGRSIFHIDQQLLVDLSPNLILTQELCPVCAPSFSDVANVTKNILSQANILSLNPQSIQGIFDNITIVGKATKTKSNAKQIIKILESRLTNIFERISSKQIQSVLIIEWLEPLMLAGHWVPEMVERAGGKMLLVKKGEQSLSINWKEILHADPDILILAPCGFNIQRTLQEVSLVIERKGFKTLRAYKTNNIFLIDGNAYLTRPGPRIIDGIEILTEILYPKLFPRKYSIDAWMQFV